MITFPNCKINIGLNIIRKRNDGFHDIESVFYPVSWADSLEIIDVENNAVNQTLEVRGLEIEADVQNNIVMKAIRAVNAVHELPGFHSVLYKNIPSGAGLGGGSSDAAATLLLLNEKFGLNLGAMKLKKIAEGLGSDVPFFIDNEPSFVSGRGEVMRSVPVDLSKYFILIVHPAVHSSTVEAYRHIAPDSSKKGKILQVLNEIPIHQWRDHLTNDFEPVVCKQHNVVADIKDSMYSSGAMYASMSGSGSAVYGIFDHEPRLNFPSKFKCFLQLPA